MFLEVILVLLGFFLLIKGADYLVDGASGAVDWDTDGGKGIEPTGCDVGWCHGRGAEPV